MDHVTAVQDLRVQPGAPVDVDGHLVSADDAGVVVVQVLGDGVLQLGVQLSCGTSVAQEVGDAASKSRHGHVQLAHHGERHSVRGDQEEEVEEDGVDLQEGDQDAEQLGQDGLGLPDFVVVGTVPDLQDVQDGFAELLEQLEEQQGEVEADDDVHVRRALERAVDAGHDHLQVEGQEDHQCECCARGHDVADALRVAVDVAQAVDQDPVEDLQEQQQEHQEADQEVVLVAEHGDAHQQVHHGEPGTLVDVVAFDQAQFAEEHALQHLAHHDEGHHHEVAQHQGVDPVRQADQQRVEVRSQDQDVAHGHREKHRRCRRAKEHTTFRNACVQLAQGVHQLDVKLKIKLLGQKNIKVRPLNENKAIENGANFISETFIFSVAGSLIFYESYRQRKKEQDRREAVGDDIAMLQDEIEYLKKNLQQYVKVDDYRPAKEYHPVVLKVAGQAGQAGEDSAHAAAAAPTDSKIINMILTKLDAQDVALFHQDDTLQVKVKQVLAADSDKQSTLFLKMEKLGVPTATE